MSKIKSLFLGPQAENMALFETVVMDIVRDTAFLRRNYQPDDQQVISEKDKLSESYLQTVAELQGSLNQVLSQLKKSVPTYHPRHIGHMNADVLMTGIAGFLSALLYNPNNIINIASPASTLMEIDYIDSLCKMVGFPPFARNNKVERGAWGHLCSGGTSANIEALWIHRNLKYFPVTLKIVAKQAAHSFLNEISLGEGTIGTLTVEELFNTDVSELYGLLDVVLDKIDKYKGENEQLTEYKSNIDFYEREILPYCVQKIGIAGIHQACHDIKENLNIPKVYVARTSHYSWEKAMDIIGLGQCNLVKVDVDRDFRLDVDDLHKKIETGSCPVLAVVSIMGTTEEGAFDPLHKVLQTRMYFEENHKKSFFIHVDGAYGGYFASCVQFEEQPGLSNEYFREYLITTIASENIKIDVATMDQCLETHFSFDEEWLASIYALSWVDSVTIDPHKLGYIPYPAGAIMFRDFRSRNHISFYAPYVTNESSQELAAIYLGQWTLEGSRPGASAVACYLSEKVLPVNTEGHGKLINCTVIGATRLLTAIEKFNGDSNRNKGYKVVPLYRGDSNVVCYIISNPTFIKSPKLLNIFTDAVFKAFAIDAKRIIPDFKFILSNSNWAYSDYQQQIDDILTHAGIDPVLFNEMEGKNLEYIRSVIMNPLSAFVSGSFYDEYLDMVANIADKALSLAFLTLLKKQNKGKRINLLWIENEVEIEELRDKFEQDQTFGRYFNVDFEIYQKMNSLEDKLKEKRYFATVVDLNLMDKNHHDSSKKEQGYKVINELKRLQQNNILAYSSFLNESNPCYEQIHEEMTMDEDVDIMLPASCLIGKSNNFDRDLLRIIYAIFEMLQKTKQI
jgi:glutamate/tyrosine decarboxylase-like PLP-dependent enzyme